MNTDEIVLYAVGGLVAYSLLKPVVAGVAQASQGLGSGVGAIGGTIATGGNTVNAWLNYLNPNTWIGSNDNRFWT